MIDTTVAIELLLVASLVAIATKRVNLPYTIALVLVGLFLGFSDLFEAVFLSQELILLIFLPPLLFEGTINMEIEMVQRRGLLIALLALVGTFISSFIIGFIVHWVIGLPLLYSILLGSIVSPTDPVSVLAIFKELGVSKELGVILEGESVFNDGVGVVFYLILLEIIGGKSVGLPQAAGELISTIAIGVILGGIIGYFTYRLLAYIDDPLTEVMISIIVAYGVYVASEHSGGSGVLAVVVAGLIIGNFGRRYSMSPTTRITMNSFWEVAAFIVNSLVFLLIGLQLDPGDLAEHFRIVLLVVPVMLGARALIVYGFSAINNLLSYNIDLAWQHVVHWGGLKATIPVALAIGLPTQMEHRSTIVATVFGIVVFSMFVQGTTLRSLLEGLGLISMTEEEVEYEMLLGRSMAIRAGLDEIQQLHQNGQISRQLYRDLKNELDDARREITDNLAAFVEQYDVIKRSQARSAVRRILRAQRTAVDEAFRRGVISEPTLERLRRQIDVRLSERGDLSEPETHYRLVMSEREESESENQRGSRKDRSEAAENEG